MSNQLHKCDRPFRVEQDGGEIEVTEAVRNDFSDRLALIYLFI
jgi:hypothetical protein